MLVCLSNHSCLPIKFLSYQKNYCLLKIKIIIKTKGDKVLSEYLFDTVLLLSKSKSTADFFCCHLASTTCTPASLDLIQETLNVRLTVDTRRGANVSGPGSAPCGTPQPVPGQPSQMSQDILMEKGELFIQKDVLKGPRVLLVRLCKGEM